VLTVFTGNPGVQFAVQNSTDVMEYVGNSISAELIETVVDQTNLYAQQIATMPRPVTVCEMKKFLGLMFLTGVIRKPKLEWYWSSRGILLTPIFSQTISRNIFQIIHRYQHFNDNAAVETSKDRLYKIRPVLDIVVNNLKCNYIPDREISLDESMLGWRGRLRFRLYNASTITKYGILIRMVCESKSGYICNMHIYNRARLDLVTSWTGEETQWNSNDLSGVARVLQGTPRLFLLLYIYIYVMANAGL
jgi:hypothetical protein